MRIIAVIVMILGLGSLAVGAMYIPQASSGNQDIAESVAPLTLDQVEGKYDAVSAQFDQVMMAEEPQIQAGQAAPSAMYNYLSAQRALLGLAKANMGTTRFVRNMGIVSIVIGVGLVLSGVGLFRKAAV
jgi:hypothetical protein